MTFKFNNLTELLLTFNTEDKCKAYFEQQRWKGRITCPHCGHGKVYRTNAGFKCAAQDCYKKFTVTVGTPLENTNIKLQKWFAAIYIFTAHKKGISSCQLAKDLGITQKSAWFMLHRIREIFTPKETTSTKLTGTIEIDETFIGGKRGNKHAHIRAKEVKTGYSSMTPVVGMLQRNGKLTLKAIGGNKVNGSILRPIVKQHIEQGANIITDGFGGYYGLDKNYNHNVVMHERNEYAKGHIHTNSIEGAFSQLKRGIYGIYHHVSNEHLNRYCIEFSYRYNTRKISDADRFAATLQHLTGSITYEQLINNQYES